MPLEKSASNEARSRNIATEIRAGKSRAQAAAIGYAIQRRAAQRGRSNYAEDGREESGSTHPRAGKILRNWREARERKDYKEEPAPTEKGFKIRPQPVSQSSHPISKMPDMMSPASHEKEMQSIDNAIAAHNKTITGEQTPVHLTESSPGLHDPESPFAGADELARTEGLIPQPPASQESSSSSEPPSPSRAGNVTHDPQLWKLTDTPKKWGGPLGALKTMLQRRGQRKDYSVPAFLSNTNVSSPAKYAASDRNSEIAHETSRRLTPVHNMIAVAEHFGGKVPSHWDSPMAGHSLAQVKKTALQGHEHAAKLHHQARMESHSAGNTGRAQRHHEQHIYHQKMIKELGGHVEPSVVVPARESSKSDDRALPPMSAHRDEIPVGYAENKAAGRHYAKDASNHEHKGKGPGGGQFAPTGGGSARPAGAGQAVTPGLLAELARIMRERRKQKTPEELLDEVAGPQEAGKYERQGHTHYGLMGALGRGLRSAGRGLAAAGKTDIGKPIAAAAKAVGSGLLRAGKAAAGHAVHQGKGVLHGVLSGLKAGATIAAGVGTAGDPGARRSLHSLLGIGKGSSQDTKAEDKAEARKHQRSMILLRHRLAMKGQAQRHKDRMELKGP
jgi:hypothetical protein